MVVDFDNLKDQLTEIIKSDQQPEIKIQLLFEMHSDEPFQQIINDASFVQGVRHMIGILMSDVDGDGELTIKDIKMTLGQELSSVDELVGSFTEIATKKPTFQTSYSLMQTLIYLVRMVPKINFKYKKGETEIFIMKLLIYIFLVQITKKIPEETRKATALIFVDYIDNLYKLIVSGNIVHSAFSEATEKLKINKSILKCLCCATEAIISNILLPEAMEKLKENSKVSTTMNKTDKKLHDLENKLETLNSQLKDNRKSEENLVAVDLSSP